ncbi:MAG: hypothetical protein ACLQDV_11675 [Candidatus Binataceae bacterium]
MQSDKRGILLTIFAILFALGAIQDALKPFRPTTNLVFLGTRLTGTTNIVMSIVVAIFLIGYAASIWFMSKYALPLSFIYGVYVVINIVGYIIRYAAHDKVPVWGLIVFTVLAIAIPWGSAMMLWRHRAELI